MGGRGAALIPGGRWGPEAKLAPWNPEMDVCWGELTRAGPPSSNGFRMLGSFAERNFGEVVEDV